MSKYIFILVTLFTSAIAAAASVESIHRTSSTGYSVSCNNGTSGYISSDSNGILCGEGVSGCKKTSVQEMARKVCANK